MMEIIKNIAWGRIIYALLAVMVAVTVARYGQPYLHDKSDAISTLVTVFSILAGFLVAIISIMGDPSLLIPGGWRIAEKQRQQISRKLVRHQWLFHIYLITLVVIFSSQIMDEKLCFSSNLLSFCYSVLLERIYLFLSTLGIIFSFRLPSALAAIQRERLDALIDNRKSRQN